MAVGGVSSAKVAVTERAAVMSSVQVSSQPEQAPSQFENCEPGSGVAVSVTERLAAKAAEQADPAAPQDVSVADPIDALSTRMGGDTITVCNLANVTQKCGGPNGTDAIAGPNSPLVVYGDTSQDGIWYGGHPSDTLGMEFGPKPFDPFTKIPDASSSAASP